MSAEDAGTTDAPDNKALAQLIAHRDGAYARATAFIPQLDDPGMSTTGLAYDQLSALAEYDHYRALVDIAVASGRPELARELLRHADTDPPHSSTSAPATSGKSASRRVRGMPQAQERALSGDAER